MRRAVRQVVVPRVGSCALVACVVTGTALMTGGCTTDQSGYSDGMSAEDRDFADSVPDCRPLAEPYDGSKLACVADGESEELRDEVLAACGMESWELDTTWFQDGFGSIQFPHSGAAGATKGATIDVSTHEVSLCE